MKKEELLKRCRYIGTGNPFEHYEKMWLDWKLGKEGAITPEFEFYDQFGLKHFNVNDGVPKGIKAYLFTAYDHWNDLNPTIEGFAKWYKEQYLGSIERMDSHTPNGGAYSIAYYYDKDKKTTNKQNAKFAEIVEYDKDNNEINRIYMSVSIN